MSETTYINSIKIKQSKFGQKMSFNLDKLIEECGKLVNEKGYVNLEILPRKTEGKYGETHSVKLDTWKPNTETNQQQKQQQPSKPIDDGLPF